MTTTNDTQHDTAEDETEADAVTGTSTRRSLVSKGILAAAVGAAAGVAVRDTASAADGDHMRIGQINGGTSSTVLSGPGTLWGFGGGTEAGAAIYGLTNGTVATSFYGVHGESGATDGAGVIGVSTEANGTGVIAQHSIQADGSGVGLAASSTNGIGITSKGPEADLKLEGSSVIQFAGEGVGGTGRGVAGELASDGGGTLFFCYADGTGNWHRLAGPTTAGSYNAITPYRAYDSRRPAPSPGLMTPGTDRVVSVADSRDGTTGAVITADAIPAEATAVTYNLTVVNTVGRGFLAVTEGDAAGTAASTINWSGAGQVVANGSTVKLDANRQVKVFNGSGGSANFIIDITGYYR